MYVRKNVRTSRIYKKKYLRCSKIFQTLPARPVRQGKKGGPVHVTGCETKALYTTALQAAPTEGLTDDFDLRLHHMPEDLELLNHKLGDTPLELFMQQGLYR
jgi:hypothetical protein